MNSTDQIDRYRKKCHEDMAFAFRKEFLIRAWSEVEQRHGLVPLDVEERVTQKAIIEETYRQLKERGRVFLLVDKSRKEGVTTIVQAIEKWVCLTIPHTLAFTVAHEENATREIFRIGKTIVDNLDPLIWPQPINKPKHNRVEFSNGSRSICFTQGGSVDSARGSTPTFLHISELPSWETSRRSTTAADVAQALLTAVPKEGTVFVYVESTAKGASGLFYQMWLRAIRNEPGNEYVPMFFSWKDNPIYRIPPANKHQAHVEKQLHAALIDAHGAGDDVGFHEYANRLGWSDLQRSRAVEFGLDPSQIRFWQTTLVNECNGDQDRFDSEWPVSWQISFVATGRPVFRGSMVQDLLKKADAHPPLCRAGSLYEDDNGIVRWRNDGGGWQVYRKPVPGHQYVAAADAANGGRTKDDDYSTVQVIDRLTGEQVAEYRGKITPDVLARELALAGQLYEDALLAPEANGPGLLVIHYLMEHHPQRKLYRRFAEPGQVVGSETRLLGYSTNNRTRHYMFGLFEGEVRNGKLRIYSTRLLGEMLSLVRSGADGRPEAAPGEHDDLCVAMCIALDVAQQQADRGIAAYEEPAARPNWDEFGLGSVHRPYDGTIDIERDLPPGEEEDLAWV